MHVCRSVYGCERKEMKEREKGGKGETAGLLKRTRREELRLAVVVRSMTGLDIPSDQGAPGTPGDRALETQAREEVS